MHYSLLGPAFVALSDLVRFIIAVKVEIIKDWTIGRIRMDQNWSVDIKMDQTRKMAPFGGLSLALRGWEV